MREDNLTNYAFHLTFQRWTLEEALSLIDGLEPLNGGDEEDLKVLMHLKKIRNKDFRYKKAIKDIKNGELKGVCEIINEPYIPININSNVKEQYFVEPKAFVKWCENESYHIEPELVKYFDCNYYLKKKPLFFNEFVNLLCSKELPLPHELKEKVFAKKETHEVAKVVKECISGKWESADKTKVMIEFFKVYLFVEKCRGRKLEFNREILANIVVFQDKEQNKMKNLMKSSKELDLSKCRRFLLKNNCTLTEGINFLIYKEVCPEQLFNNRQLALIPILGNRIDKNEIERLFFADMDKGKIEVIENSRNPYEYSVEPKKFTKWAIKNKFIDKNHELTIAYRERYRNKIKTSDINQKCLEWLLEECKKSPSKPPKNKMPSPYKTGSMFEDAQEKFPNIGKREFERTWKKATTNCPNWNKSGRK